MNDLNLRVAALKLCAHPKRFAELRDALVPLPNTWIAAPHDFVRQFAAAKSSAEQVQVVKDVFYGDQQQDHEKVPRFLADLLLASPLKHAVRNQLTKLFSDNALAKQKAMPHHRHERNILLEALEQSLSEMASSLAVITPPVSHERTNDVFASANACMQNFPFGREALGKQVHLFAPLLTTALERYWTDICDPSLELSPTRRNELYLYAQNALRFLVSLLAEWSDQLHLTEDQRFPGTANVVAQQVARHEDTPWDVRSIAGLLIGHLARFSGTFQKYVEHCSMPQAEQDVPAQTAALLVLRPDDYAENAAHALAILKTIVAVGEQKSTVTNLLVFLSKHLFIYSKSLGEIHAHLPKDQKLLYAQILAQLQVFALQNISSDTDSVRHMSSALLHQVLQHAQAVGQEELFQVVYRQFEDRAATLNANCMALEQLVAVAGVNQAIENCPSLFGVIFPRHLGCEDSVDALFKAMMVSAHKTEPFAEWQSRWFGQLLAAIRVPEKRRPVIEELIAQAVQLEPTRLSQLLLPDTRLPLSCKLAAILGVRQLSARRQNLLRSMKEEVEQALIGLDDHTRLLALRFLVETPRPSELLNADQMGAIELYVRHNANNPSAHLRQLGHGLLQKALKRVHFGLVEYRKSRTPASQEVFQFLIRLIRILSENLFPSANYGRRWLSLRLLRNCLELTEMVGITFSEMGIELPTKALMACLGDSYEHNKVLAAQLLETFQSHSLFKPDEMIQLLRSLRPSDSATGAFQLQVYCKANIVQSELPTPTHGDTIHEPLTFRALQWCLRHLKEGLCLAQLDLAEAAKLNPLYGLLFASRHLLQQLKLKELAKEPDWRQYIEELVAICLAVSSVVLPVVSSASPEGHLPETCDQETDQPLTNVLDRQMSREELQQVRTTPQMILLCAWRSSKEVCLILGELVERAPLEEEEQQRQGDFLLSCAQLEAIGEHFLTLLAETKHRGAFEQAYVGFTMLCRRFWHSESVRLNQLPGQWVNEAMAMVSGQEECSGRGARLCATRRSAGMPFMLQALVCTELKLGTHATLYRCMHHLLWVCERRTAGAAGITARSHALNIMRALFRSSELAELVTEFMARGIQCALDGLLLAEEWAERNSATLLLAALIVRIFGVERARLETGELHVRNRMTGRIFFTRYPQLFDYFHAALQRESEQMDSGGAGSDNAGGKRRQAVQLEAMLLMLSRLYPSSLEGAESTLNLSEFVPFLIRICHSHDLLTREMAAQVVANFVTQEQALAEIRRIVIELKALQLRLEKQKEAPNLNINLLHGQLLLLLHLHRLVRWTHPSLTRMQLHTLAALAAPLLQQDACAFSALVEVMVAAMEDAVEPGLLDFQLLEQIGAVYLLDHKEVQGRCQLQGISKRFYQIFGLHLHRLRGISQGIVLHIVEDLAEPIWALDELKVELWLYILLQRSLSKPHSLVTEADIEHFDFSGDIRRYFETLSQEQREEVVQEVYESPAVRSSVLQMIKSSRSCCWSLQLAGRLAALQPLLRDPELDMNQLVQRCSEEHSTHQEAGLLLGLRRLIGESKTLERKHWLPVLNYAQHLLHPGQPVYLRHQAAELCDLLARNHLRDQLGAGNTDVDIELVGRFIGLVLLLLHDDAEWVRHRAVQLVCGAGLRSGAEREQGARAALILPSALTQDFLDTMIYKVTVDDVKVVERLVNIISEPFTSSAAKELFDKQENNHYCERNHVLVGLWEARARAYSRTRTPLNEVSNN